MTEFIMLKGVRVSFPHLFTKPVINGEEGSFGAVFMLKPKKQKGTIEEIETGISDVCKERFKGKKVPSDKRCLRDGDDKGRPEYEGYMVVSANSRSKPVVLASDGRTVITDPDDDRIYAGCYVNAKIRLWGQDNQYGKRVNAELVAIQFVGDGDALDASYVSHDDAVEGFGETDDGDDFLNS